MTRLPDLRDELVRAARRQDERHRMLGWRPFLVGSVTAVTISGAALAATGTPVPGFSSGPPEGPKPKSAAAARRVSLQNQAYALINRANEQTWVAMPRCRPTAQATGGPGQVLTSSPPDEALEVLAALRRPATAEEAALARGRAVRDLGGATYARSVRAVLSADGERFFVAAVRTGGGIFRPRPGCLDAQHDRLEQLVEASPPRLRSLALQRFSFFRTGQEHNLRVPSRPHTAIAFIGAGGGATDIDQFRTRGAFSAGNRANEPVRVTGLVPDGVRTIEFAYPKIAGRGRDYRPVTYPSAVKRNVRVDENVVSFTVPRSAPDALRARITWRNARGQVLRVIRADRDG